MQRLSAGNEPALSVLLPYRDARATLAEALDSILAQRGVAFELIAIDDGSRDAGAQLVHALAARDPRIVALRSEGVGIARALNLGLGVARAPLIARMDADDVALPGRLAAQLEAMHAEPQVAALGTRVEAFGDPPARLAEGMQRYIAWQNALLDPRAHRDQLFVESPLCHPSVMLRRDALEAIGGYRDGPFAEDYDLWLRLDGAGLALAKLPDVLLRWRQHERAATRSDPRYARDRFALLKAPHLAARLRARPRPLDVWGAGPTGGARIEPLAALAPASERWVVVALGARGARDEARAHLAALGYREGDDYLCAS